LSRLAASSTHDELGLWAEAGARYCAFIGLGDERRYALHFSDELGDIVLVRFEPVYRRSSAVLTWVDDDHLLVDLGEVAWLTPQFDQLGHVAVGYTYAGAEPSLE
jgi:hypothetical protein